MHKQGCSKKYWHCNILQYFVLNNFLRGLLQCQFLLFEILSLQYFVKYYWYTGSSQSSYFGAWSNCLASIRSSATVVLCMQYQENSDLFGSVIGSLGICHKEQNTVELRCGELHCKRNKGHDGLFGLRLLFEDFCLF